MNEENSVSPFAMLEVPERDDVPSPELLAKWIMPFYSLNLWMDGEKFLKALRPVYHEINDDIVGELLSYRNWRPRIVGAYLAGVRRLTSQEGVIGSLLLRSELVAAGKGYCFALARMGTPSATALLCRYLDYYLGQPNLWYDQSNAMAALGYIDRRDGTTIRQTYLEKWRDFVANKPHWNLEQMDDGFELSLSAINAADVLGA